MATLTQRRRHPPMRTICNGYNCTRVLPVIRPRQNWCSEYCRRNDRDKRRNASFREEA